jgi:hypothetical protein
MTTASAMPQREANSVERGSRSLPKQMRQIPQQSDVGYPTDWATGRRVGVRDDSAPTPLGGRSAESDAY